MLRVKKLLFLRAVCFIIILCIPLTVSAGTDIFLRMQPIVGESTAKGHVDWIDVSAVGYDVMQTLSGSLGTGRLGPAQFGPITILKKVDRASLDLFIAPAQGKQYAKAEIEFVNDANPNTVIFKIILENVVVQSLSSTTTNDGLEEIVTLVYDVITFEYTKVSDDGSEGTMFGPVGWDLNENRLK